MSEPSAEPTEPSVVERIAEVLRAKRFHYNSEVVLHEGIALAFEEAGIDYIREAYIDGGRIDFIVGSVGVEVKIGGSSADLARQVSLYTESPHISEILVITTRPAHREVAGVANGKTIGVLTLGGLSL